MARTKKAIKVKEPVRLRCKDLANGNKSLYLDLYQEGARSYEFLKLYIIPEKSPADKVANANTMQVANAIKAQRLLEIANGKAGLKTNKGKILFVDWLKEYERIKIETKNYGSVINATIIQVKAYKGNVSLNHIDKNYIVGFLKFLNSQSLSNNSQYTYYRVISGALNTAYQKGYINENPLQRVPKEEKPHHQDGQRAYLTIEDIKTLMKTDCRNEHVKKAFLFSCFCGLRISDVKRLKWQDITTSNGQSFANIMQEKTDVALTLPLSEQAMYFLPEKRDKDEFIFTLPPVVTVTRILKQWQERSGIDKHITFHVSRHTFATLSLTAGVDLYTTSKLLGHTDVKTTQIYAKIIDEKKNDAVNKIADLFNNI